MTFDTKDSDAMIETTPPMKTVIWARARRIVRSQTLSSDKAASVNAPVAPWFQLEHTRRRASLSMRGWAALAQSVYATFPQFQFHGIARVGGMFAFSWHPHSHGFESLRRG